MKFITLAASLLLAGCAATPPTAQWRYTVPPERVYHKEWTAPGSDRVPVALVRDTNLAGGACTWRFLFNDTHVVTVANGEGIQLQVPPGTYDVRLAVSFGICPPYSTSRTVIVEPGKPLLLWADAAEWSPQLRALPLP